MFPIFRLIPLSRMIGRWVLWIHLGGADLLARLRDRGEWRGSADVNLSFTPLHPDRWPALPARGHTDHAADMVELDPDEIEF